MLRILIVVTVFISSFANAQHINDPMLVGVVNGGLDKDFAESNKKMDEVVNKLSDADYFKATKALKVAKLYRDIQSAQSERIDSEIRSLVVKANAQKEIKLAALPVAQSTDSVQGGEKPNGSQSTDIPAVQTIQVPQELVLNYISGSVAGLTNAGRQVRAVVGDKVGGETLINIGSDSIRLRSKNGKVRTLYMNNEFLNIPPEKKVSKKTDALTDIEGN